MTTTAPLALGSHTILAVYSGDDSFSSSALTDPNGSSASVNVVGQTLSIDSLYLVGGGTVCQGSVATLKGTVSGLDGAAFSVTVVWGDGQTSDSDNGGQPFYCAAGTTTFLVTHYYAVPGDFTLDVTATAADGRQVEDNSSVSLNVTPACAVGDPRSAPRSGGRFAQHPDSEYTVSAEAFSADPASLTYEWTLEGTTVLSTGSSSVTVTGAEYDDVWLTVGSSGGPRRSRSATPRRPSAWSRACPRRRCSRSRRATRIRWFSRGTWPRSTFTRRGRRGRCRPWGRRRRVGGCPRASERVL